MAGADGDSGGHEAAAGFGVPCLVAADVEVAGDFFCFDGVAVAVAGHTRGGDDVFIGTLFQDGVDEHGLGIGIVEGFADDLVIFQDGRHVVFGEADEVRADVDEGIDVGNLPGQGVGFALAQVADHVGLAVEVAGIDGIEVDEVQMADAGPGQVDGGVGTQSAETADGDAAGADFLVDFRCMAGTHHAFQGFFRRQAVFGDEIDFIALFQGQVLCRGKAVDDGDFLAAAVGGFQVFQVVTGTIHFLSVQY